MPRAGRPLENPDARIDKTGKPFVVVPDPGGAHSWQPTAFDPATGLVYIPAQEAGFPYIPDAHFQPASRPSIPGSILRQPRCPPIRRCARGALAATKGALIAWDPVAQQERWRVDFKGPWNGGLLATGGGLVFQGNGAKEFVAYDAASGAKLWASRVQTGITAPPVTYAVKGEQYVAVLAGWGGVWALAPGILSEVGGPVRNVSRLLVFKAGGTRAAAAGVAPGAGAPRSAVPERYARAARRRRAAVRALLRRLPWGCGLRQHRRAGPAPQCVARARAGPGQKWCTAGPCMPREW